MFATRISRSCLWLISLCAVLSLGLNDCGEDDSGKENGWVGTWSLHTVDRQDWGTLFLSFGATVDYNKWTFHDDGTWEVELTVSDRREQWAEQMSGAYSITDTTFSISSPDPGFSFYFSISTEFSIDESLDSEQSSEPKEETGTWVRGGNTLALTRSDGQILVFEKL